MNRTSESKRTILAALMFFCAGIVLYNIGWSPITGAGFLYCGMVICWIMSVRQRVSGERIRGRFTQIAVLMLMLLVLRSSRYLLSEMIPPQMSRMLWYLYYLPFTMIPLAGLDASLMIRDGEKQNASMKILLLSLACIVLNLLFLSNDLHQLAFRFTENGVHSEQKLHYTYGPLYYAAVCWIAGCVAAMLHHLIRENSRAGNVRIPGMLWIVLLVPCLYFVSYYLGNLPQLRGRRVLQLPEAYCMFFICLLECCLLTGWFPLRILKEKENAMQAEASEVERTNLLYRNMAADVAPQLAEINRILEMAESDADETAVRREMAKACVMTAYIKRRCNLVLQTAEQETLPPEALRLSVMESLEYLRLCGITGAAFLEGCNAGTDGRQLVAAFDFYEKAAELAMQGADALLVNIHAGEKQLNMRLTLEEPAAAPGEELYPDCRVQADENVYYLSRIFEAEEAEDTDRDHNENRGGQQPDTEKQEIRPAEKLSELSKLITAYTIEKEQLNARKRLHDDLGKMLLMGRRYVQGKCDRESMLAEWRYSSRLLEEEKAQDPAGSPAEEAYRYMETVARDVGIRLTVEGELPREPAAAEVAASAIHECLTNTIRHAGGDELRIRVSGDTIEFSNNGRPPSGPIEESGGLGMLRRMAESRGMKMQTEASPAFRLTLYLKPEDEQESEKNHV